MKLTIKINERVFDVEVEVAEEESAPKAYGGRPVARVPAAPPVAPSPSASSGEAVADESKVCRSPVAGTVVRVDVQPGKTFAVGQTLLVLEAMKMETAVSAARAGTVSVVRVKLGDAVRANQILVEYE